MVSKDVGISACALCRVNQYPIHKCLMGRIRPMINVFVMYVVLTGDVGGSVGRFVGSTRSPDTG